MHPEGTFDGTVVDCGFTDPGQDRAQQVFVTLENEEGQTITAYLSLSAAAVKWTIRKLEACGWNREVDPKAETIEQGELKGARVSYVVEHATWEGKTRAKVGWINKPGSVKRGEATQESRQRIAAALMNMGDADDDVPF